MIDKKQKEENIKRIKLLLKPETDVNNGWLTNPYVQSHELHGVEKLGREQVPFYIDEVLIGNKYAAFTVGKILINCYEQLEVCTEHALYAVDMKPVCGLLFGEFFELPSFAQRLPSGAYIRQITETQSGHDSVWMRDANVLRPRRLIKLLDLKENYVNESSDIAMTGSVEYAMKEATPEILQQYLEGKYCPEVKREELNRITLYQHIEDKEYVKGIFSGSM